MNTNKNEHKEMMKTSVIYARVSSVGDRQNTDRQVKDLTKYASQNNYAVQNTYEEHISGAKLTSERPVLQQCLQYCIDNKIDTLLLSELSRLGRNSDEVLSNVRHCKQNKLNIYFQKENMSIFQSDGKPNPFLNIFISVLSTCAEMERENITFRLQSGLRNYKENGGKVGRKIGYRKPTEKLKEEYASVLTLLRKGVSIRVVAQSCGVGVSTVARLKKTFI